MARFVNSFNKGLETGYGFANKADKNKASSQKNAYERYIEEHYGPGVTSHRDPLAVARAAAGQVGSAVWGGVKTGAGALGHAAAGLLGAPQGPGRAVSDGRGGIGSDTGAVSGITPSNRLYEGNPGTGAGVSAYNPGLGRQGVEGMLDAISRAEGTTKNGYNEVLGYGAYGRPSRPITDMTLQEVHDYGRNTLFAGQRAQGIPENKLSSATGRYQITGNNIKDYATKWGLDMKTTKWTPQLQDRIAIDLAKNTPKALANWEGFKSNPKLKQQALAAMQGKDIGPSPYSSSTQVAQLQRDLNAKGANLEVDGIAGPLTRAAQQKYSGTAYASNVQDEGRVPTAGRAQAPVQVASAEVPGLGTTRGLPIGPGPARAAPNVPQTPYYSNPYTSSTGGAITADRPAAPAIGTAYNAYEAQRNAARLGPTVAPRQVQTQAVDATGYPPVQMQGAFNRPIPNARGAVPQTPAFMNPYAGTTGGANAIQAPMQTARIPQPRPPQAPQARPDQAVPTTPAANWTLADIQRWADQHGIPVSKAAGVLSDIGSRVGNAVSSGGMGQSFSGAQNSGLGYVGGRGYGGGSINRGTGGAINPNR